MPKIIENLKENILAEARLILQTEGYTALTVRRVAGSLGIGVGTIYNYYPSKLELAAGVLEEDWYAGFRKYPQSATFSTPEETLKALFEIVHDFSLKYSWAWREYVRQPSNRILLNHYYDMIVGELSGYISQTLPDDQLEAEPFLPALLGEFVLRFGAAEPYDYERIRPGVEKLLRPI